MNSTAGSRFSQGAFGKQSCQHHLFLNLIPSMTKAFVQASPKTSSVSTTVVAPRKNNVVPATSKRKQVSNQDLHMTLVSPEDFELASGEGDLRARFRQGLHGLASSSDTDDTSKLTARAPTAETACFFPPPILMPAGGRSGTFADEVFSLTLSPED
jgi:hypothetical protein